MSIKLRPAQLRDCDLLFRWANDPVVRKNAFNSDLILFENHKKWFNNRLYCDSCNIYICYLDNNPIGQIRIDIKDDIGEIDYSIDTEFRGKGYGYKLLLKLEEMVKQTKINIDTLIGNVKDSNIASKKSFKKAGYDYVVKRNYTQFSKNIENI